MTFRYSSISSCITFQDWLACEWRIRRRWEGPYRLIYENGIRFFGVEITWESVNK